MAKAIVVNSGTLIVGTPMEFGVNLYAALLQRLPDRHAIGHFRWNVDDDPERRLDEVRKVVDSAEFQKKKNIECMFGEPAADLYALDQRIANFLSYCLPVLPTILQNSEDIVEMKAQEISELLQAALAKNVIAERTALERPAADTVAALVERVRDLESEIAFLRNGYEQESLFLSDPVSEKIDALAKEIEKLKVNLKYEMPKKILGTLNNTIMINNAILERQFGADGDDA